MTVALSVLAPSMDPLIKTPGKGSPDTIIGANEMTKAMINFAALINNLIMLNAQLSVQLASFQNAVNTGLPGLIKKKETDLNIDNILKDANPTQQDNNAVSAFSAYQNQVMSEGQAETQSVQTSLTGATNAIQALQQSQNEFTTEAGSTVDTTLANDRIQ